jgi:hypothetical protein
VHQELRARLAAQYPFLTQLAGEGQRLGPGELSHCLLKCLELAEETLLEFRVYGERWGAGGSVACLDVADAARGGVPGWEAAALLLCDYN